MTPQATMDDKIQISDVKPNLKDFETFVKIFISDQKIQKTHIKYPFLSLTLTDPTTDIYDTVVVKKAGTDFIEITTSLLESKKFEYQINKLDSKQSILTLRGVETGVHVEYLFELQNEEWMLIKITDSST